MTVYQSISSYLSGKPPQADSPLYIPDILDLTQPTLYISLASILFNPLFWNIVAQNEYHNKTITRLLKGNRFAGCYGLAVTIFLLGIVRDHLYNEALKHQPSHPLLSNLPTKVLATTLVLAGNVFVLSSMWALGVTGTYLGDYFGILMDHMVTGFPFNVMSDPMYWGSSMSFAGVALWFAKPAGLLLTVVVITAYTIALRYEGPFTSEIYAAAARKGHGSSNNNKTHHLTSKSFKEEGGEEEEEEDAGPAHRTRAATGHTIDSAPSTPSKRTRSRKAAK